MMLGCLHVALKEPSLLPEATTHNASLQEPLPMISAALLIKEGHRPYTYSYFITEDTVSLGIK